MSESTESTFVKHAPCPAPGCSSSDGLAIYTDHEICFVCGYQKQYKETKKTSPSKPLSPMREIKYDTTPPHRGLEPSTLNSYSIGFKGEHIVFQYRDRTGQFCAQKIRELKGDPATGKRKTIWRGTAKAVTAFGMHLANPAKHKLLCICEGELDAPSIYQSMGGKVAAVSVPNGAGQAAKFVRERLDEFMLYDVVVCTDNDDAGNEAAGQIMDLFEPGKVRRALFPKKDANETLTELGSLALKEVIESAKVIRPDGIKSAADYAGLVLKPPDRKATDCAFAFWNAKTPFYDNQMIVLIAGSGIGKTTFARALCIHDMERGIKCGWIGLEETADEAVFRFVGMAAGIQLHARQDYLDLTPEQMQNIEQADKFITGSGNLELFDHFGSIDEEIILQRMNYMVRSLGCKHIYLDHLTIIGSGLGQDTRHLDSLITKIRTFISGTRCTVFCISHLSRQQGQNFENGDVPELQAIRGSHGIVQLADTIWALGRKRGTNDTTSHCLKNRMLGRTGYAGHFTFNEKTQQLDHKWVDPVLQ